MVQSGLTGLPSRSEVSCVTTERATASTSSPRLPPQDGKSRLECQPPILEAPSVTRSSRRLRIIRSSSALRASASGSMSAATGVANKPLTWTSPAAILGFPLFS